MNNLIINTTYFGPIELYTLIKNSDNVFIEQYENYGKQSYRNRCEIMSANGKLTLSIPVKKSETIKTLTKDIVIDYDTNWQKIHFKAIESAYRKSPYYEYYIDLFMVFFEKREKFLLDFNTKILEQTLKIIQLNPKIGYTKDYIKDYGDNICDYRDCVHPKKSRVKSKEEYVSKTYYQTFAEKFPFEANLSILDLIFNMGTESKLYL